MSVLAELTMFPTSGDESKSKFVAEVLKVIKNSGYEYKLTPMATIIETKNISQALQVVQDCYLKLESMGCARVFSTLKLDIRVKRENGIETKIRSIESIVGEVKK